MCLRILRYIFIRVVRNVICFDFKIKNHLNCKIKKHAVWFGLIDLK